MGRPASSRQDCERDDCRGLRTEVKTSFAIARAIAFCYISDVKRIAYSKAAFRTLSRIPANVAMLIRSKLEQHAADPAAQANNVKALKGEAGVYRLRVGDWHVLFTDAGEVIAIIKIAPRGGAYD